jgi:hypothetical protein
MPTPAAILQRDRATRKMIRSRLAFGKRTGMSNTELAAHLADHDLGVADAAQESRGGKGAAAEAARPRGPGNGFEFRIV